VTFLCGRNADLGDVIAAAGGFVVHVLGEGDEALADRFAGIRPSPGGLFAGLEVIAGRWGPILTTLPTRVECRLLGMADSGWYQSIEGAVESVLLGDTAEPLLRYRGRYHFLEGR
jgi:flavin reductase (DIM6/NTAB) family NADH-FMN oxidoreductase RutF